MSEGVHANPFDDPSSFDGNLLETDQTLLLEHNASLTLGADSLIVLGTYNNSLCFYKEERVMY